MYILYCYADSNYEWNCSDWRCLRPSNALNGSGRHVGRCIYLHSLENYLDPAVQNIVGPADAIMIQRNILRQPIWDFSDYWRGMGKIVVADLDDAYQMMPWSNPAHGFWERNKGKLDMHPIDALKEGLRHVDGLTAPSKQLLEDWADVVPGYWLPNWATGAWYKNLPERKRENGEIVIGWGGSVSHYDSFWGSGVRPALNAICAEFPQVKVKICGNDARIYEQLPVPESQKMHQPGVQPEDWPKQVATFDIGIAPLSGEYDQRRSWIKALEYLLVGIPWIGAEGRPYAEFKEYGVLIPQTVNDWYKALREMVVHYDDYLGRARENRKVGWENTLEERIDEYVGTFAKIDKNRRGRSLPGVQYIGWPQTQTTGTDRVAPLLAP